MSYKWFGELPEHWESKRGIALFKENKAKNSALTHTLLLQFTYGDIVRKPNQNITDADIEIIKKYTIVKPNDIVVNGLNLNYDFVTQRVGRVTEEGIITSAYVILRCNDSYNPLYATYMLKALDAQKIFHGMGNGLRLTLNYSEFARQYFPLPPRDEQDAIVRYLDDKCSKIDRAINLKRKQIKLWQEYKARLISDVVTGQLDGRGVNVNGN